MALDLRALACSMPAPLNRSGLCLASSEHAIAAPRGFNEAVAVVLGDCLRAAHPVRTRAALSSARLVAVVALARR